MSTEITTVGKQYDFADKSEWIVEVEEMNTIRKKAPWEMAYLCLWGINTFCHDKNDVADLYDEMSEQLELARKTLQNYVSVARRFSPDDIFERLEIGHHIVVVALPDDIATYWLTRAEANAWSVARLRAEIKAAAQTPSEDDGDDDTVDVRMAVVHLLAQHEVEAIAEDTVLTMKVGGHAIQVGAKGGKLEWSIV